MRSHVFTKKQILPKTFNFKLILSDTHFWHRLEHNKSWIFRKQQKSATITYTNPVKTFKFDISGMSNLTTSPYCEKHLDNLLILPLNNVIALRQKISLGKLCRYLQKLLS